MGYRYVRFYRDGIYDSRDSNASPQGVFRHMDGAESGEGQAWYIHEDGATGWWRGRR